MGDSYLTAEEQARIKENEMEETTFSESLEKLLTGDQITASKPLIVGRTPNSLVISGASADMNLTITKKVIDKAMRPENRNEEGKLVGSTGHGLSKELMKQSLFALKCPLLVFRGSRDQSLLVITEIRDDKDRTIVVAVDLERQEGFEQVNSIRSTYGRDNLERFIEESIKGGRLVAVNKEKTDEMLRSIEKSYLKENTFVSFDNTIAFSLKNVNQQDVKQQD